MSDGQDRPSWWTRAPVIISAIALIGGLAAFLNYRKSLQDERELDYKTAIDNYQKGMLPAIPELGRFGEKGVQALVDGVRPVPSSAEPEWPRVTRAALDEIQRHEKILTDKGRQDLRDALKNNRQALEALLIEIETPNVEPNEAQQQSLDDLVCVQLKLLKIVPPPDDVEWERLRDRADDYLAELPDC